MLSAIRCAEKATQLRWSSETSPSEVAIATACDRISARALKAAGRPGCGSAAASRSASASTSSRYRATPSASVDEADAGRPWRGPPGGACAGPAPRSMSASAAIPFASSPLTA